MGYLRFASTLLFTADTHGYKLTENVIDPYGNTLLSKRYIAGAGNELGYYAMNTDVRGSTTNVIRPNGTSVTGFVYDEFGNQIKTGESDFIVDATYTGSIYDEETELQYMNSRYYDPGIGRFISKDSYLGSSHEPWTQHLYGYTGGNPINYTDPTGHISDEVYHRNINKNNDQISARVNEANKWQLENQTESPPGKMAEPTEVDYQIAEIFLTLGTEIYLPLKNAYQARALFKHYANGSGELYKVDPYALYLRDPYYRGGVDDYTSKLLKVVDKELSANGFKPRTISFVGKYKKATTNNDAECAGTLGLHTLHVYMDLTVDHKSIQIKTTYIATDLYNFDMSTDFGRYGAYNMELVGLAKTFNTYGYWQTKHVIQLVN